MRRLWRIGWMHNRVRMIASFHPVRHPPRPWQNRAAWFMDEPVDAAPARSSAATALGGWTEESAA
ncbi:FAD-binding domain-containing protein [Roseomonas chloroacetimidivorans]|uniref:FAD-binding domain-containing protein n=1 Tax=Roseomonas chloroacetimidivorans TaxID=1766656 RepID=UPI003C70B7B0